MRKNKTNASIKEFVDTLVKMGGSSGNKNLRNKLGWEEELYWRVQGQLIGDARISTGRGRGGSVRLIDPAETEQVATQVAASERSFYAPLKLSIEKKWINRFALDDVLIDETHSRGSKDTLGTFTRPDITAAGVRRYIYLPNRLEIITIEVKTAQAVSIIGVLEAIAHREAAHRAYVMYATSRTKFDDAKESERIMELAQKYGIGIVLAEQADAVDSWEIIIDAVRHEPDPARLDRFLVDLPSENMKNYLAKWKS